MAPFSPRVSLQSGSTDKDPTFGMIGAIVDFEHETICCKKPKLSDLLKREACEIMADDNIPKHCEGQSCSVDSRVEFRWIHVPVNKMDWAKAVVENVLKTGCEEESLKEWLFFKDRWELQRRGVERFHPLHAQYMQPNFWAYKGNSGKAPGNYTLFMPYLTFDMAESNCKRREMVKWVLGEKETKCPSIPKAKANTDNLEPKYIDSALIAKYLGHASDLHVRRTLNQFYYDHEQQTDARDDDQIVFKYTKEHLNDISNLDEPILIVVDQLWLWILQDAATPTIVTSFPSMFREGRNKEEGAIAFRGSDLFECIIRDLWNDSTPYRPTSQSLLDLAWTIVKKASRTLVSRTLPYHKQFLFMYETEIAISAWTQTQLWNNFRNHIELDVQIQRDDKKQIFSGMGTQKELEKSNHAKAGKDDNNGKNKGDDNHQKLYDLSKEIQLAMKIIGVLDELKIISIVIDDQKAVVEDMKRVVEDMVNRKEKEVETNTSQEINPPRRDPRSTEAVEHTVERLILYASREYTQLKDLLDLKQKQASIVESVSTTEQGRTVLVFTIVTVIFLPPTFFASIFSMNMSELNSASIIGAKTVFAIGVPASATLIVLFLLFACHAQINPVLACIRENPPTPPSQPSAASSHGYTNSASPRSSFSTPKSGPSHKKSGMNSRISAV